MKKALFIDRDGTIVREPADEQVDAWEKLSFLPGVMHALRTIRELTGYEFIMVTNQDGLGTPSNPAEKFWPIHNFIMDTLAGEGITFDAVHIDEHFPQDNHPNRKPGIGMLTDYLDGSYDMANCYVIGDRDTDVQLAANLGCKALKIGGEMTWEKITEILVAGDAAAPRARRISPSPWSSTAPVSARLPRAYPSSTTCSPKSPTTAAWGCACR